MFQPTAPLTHAERLARLAQVGVRVGLNLAPGQELVIQAPMEALPMVRAITVEAYRAGASLVTAMWSDDEMTLARYRHAPDASFDASTGWLFDGMAAAIERGAARLGISADTPGLLANENASHVSRVAKARALAFKPVMDLVTASAVNWTVMSAATPSWAQKVLPGVENAEQQLWDAIFAACRIDEADPVAAWAEHNANLLARRALLDGKRYAALRFTGPGTDLTVGLADGHAWKGGLSTARNGITQNPNLPTEEVFTSPHRCRTHGTVSSTKPLSYQGAMISGIQVRFEDGMIVDAHAEVGEAALQTMISSDEGARRLGEVALVPHSSPIAQAKIPLFMNTLFDENAASHIALGQCYQKCFGQGASMSKADVLAQGGNSSLIHVDWMIGSRHIDVDGITAGGGSEPVMRAGEWV